MMRVRSSTGADPGPKLRALAVEGSQRSAKDKSTVQWLASITERAGDVSEPRAGELVDFSYFRILDAAAAHREERTDTKL
jgi:hypothetical protein